MSSSDDWNTMRTLQNLGFLGIRIEFHGLRYGRYCKDSMRYVEQILQFYHIGKEVNKSYKHVATNYGKLKTNTMRTPANSFHWSCVVCLIVLLYERIMWCGMWIKWNVQNCLSCSIFMFVIYRMCFCVRRVCTECISTSLQQNVIWRNWCFLPRPKKMKIWKSYSSMLVPFAGNLNQQEKRNKSKRAQEPAVSLFVCWMKLNRLLCIYKI